MSNKTPVVEVEAEVIVEDTSPNEELIRIVQLPIIAEQLLQLKQKNQDLVQEALSKPCTEETYKEIKELRTKLNKEFKALETQRKDVKSKVLAPYEAFEAVYKECVTNIFKPADEQLKDRIDVVTDTLKNEKRQKVVEYFEELKQSMGIDFIEFHSIGIDVTMAVSLKKLKEESKRFLERVSSELTLIDSQEHKEEILLEYKSSLNVAEAITKVQTRYKLIEEEKARQAEREARRKAEEAKQAAVEAVIEEEEQFAPEFNMAGPVQADVPDDEKVAIPESTDEEIEKIYEILFRVRGNRKKISDLKAFLIEGGYEYFNE